MNHCWRAFEAPVSGWMCTVPLRYEQHFTESSPNRWSRTCWITFLFLYWLKFWTEHLCVSWSLICEESRAVPVGGNALRPPNPISTERLRRLTRSGRGAELVLFLSFNHTGLLILSWTRPGPFVTFYGEQAERSAATAASVPGTSAASCIFMGAFHFATTLLVIVRCWVWLMFCPSGTRTHTRALTHVRPQLMNYVSVHWKHTNQYKMSRFTIDQK